MTPSEIDELERLMTAATPGPWLLTGDSTLVNVTHTTRDVWTFPRTEADMVYLGGLLNAAPALLEAARRAEGYQRECHEIDQVLGRALGYPPNPDGAGGICTGEHTPASLACEAAREVTLLRERIAYLEAGLDAIRRHHSATSGCLPTCAATVYVDDDCDCGYVEADLPGDLAAAVIAGEADLSGSMRARSATLR